MIPGGFKTSLNLSSNFSCILYFILETSPVVLGLIFFLFYEILNCVFYLLV